MTNRPAIQLDASQPAELIVVPLDRHDNDDQEPAAFGMATEPRRNDPARMPNHVHLLVNVWETPLAELVKSWKSFVAREANRVLGRNGTFWEREYLDTVIADEEHRRTATGFRQEPASDGCGNPRQDHEG